jgi:8-oxo-dGDP phosphatase
MDLKWQVTAERTVYESPWVQVDLANVTLPNGTEIEHHIVRQPNTKSTGTVVLAHDDQQRVLMLWRHRFITDTWTWELPGGGVEVGETPKVAAAREFEEETGWKAGKLHPLTVFEPMNGWSDYVTFAFVTQSPQWIGEPADRNESSDIAWLTLDEIRTLMRKGDVSDAISCLSLLWAMQFGPFVH